MSGLKKTFRRFFRRSDGNATIEFVILFPGIMTLFLMGFEAGFLMVRNVSLERAVDIAVRDVRLGNLSADGEVPGHDAIKRNICANVIAISDCFNTVKVEVLPVMSTPGNILVTLGGQVRCVDRSAPEEIQQGVGNFNVGTENQLMLLHVCATVDPLFPTSRVGVGLVVDPFGNEAIVATTAFVNEPGTRFISGAGASFGGEDDEG